MPYEPAKHVLTSPEKGGALQHFRLSTHSASCASPPAVSSAMLRMGGRLPSGCCTTWWWQHSMVAMHLQRGKHRPEQDAREQCSKTDGSGQRRYGSEQAAWQHILATVLPAADLIYFRVGIVRDQQAHPAGPGLQVRERRPRERAWVGKGPPRMPIKTAHAGWAVETPQLARPSHTLHLLTWPQT